MALAVSVLDDIDLLPGERGLTLLGVPPVFVPWDRVGEAVGGADPDGAVARRRLAGWLRAARAVAGQDAADLVRQARPLGCPVGAELHPGPGWVRERVLGGALDLGLGLVAADSSAPEVVLAVPQGVLDLRHVDARPWWPPARAYLDEMAALAVARWRREPAWPLRPMGECDVVTLLGSARLRRALADSAGGMRTAAVPMRDRGWVDLRRIDPAFALAAAAATPVERRGFPRPLLITADEVTVVPDGGRPAALALRDPAPADR